MTVLNTPVMATNNHPYQDLVSLRQVLDAIHIESCPYHYNFHMHTNHSDGQLRPEALVQQTIDLGLSGFAITDHHQITGSYTAHEYLREWQLRPENVDRSIPQLWTGVEITAKILDVEVHILGYAFDSTHPAITSYFTGSAPTGTMAQAGQVVEAIHQAGGIAVLAHPARYRKAKEDLIAAMVKVGVDGIETYYAYNNPKPWRASPAESQQVEALTKKHQLLRTCGTDSHGLSLEIRV
jgi:predicted metal-dependent phosphoesterase TrpH